MQFAVWINRGCRPTALSSAAWPSLQPITIPTTLSEAAVESAFFRTTFKSLLKCTIHLRISCGPGQRSRYSYSLRAGRSGDQMRSRAIFPSPVETSPGIHPTSCIVDTGSLSWGCSGRVVVLTIPPPFSAEVKDRVELYIQPSPPPDPSWPVLG